MHYLPSPEQTRTLDTDALRAGFLLPELFHSGLATLRFVEMDRVVLGGIVPLGEPVELTAPTQMAAEFFLERREAGLLNIGGPGSVLADGTEYAMANRDGLYLGRGTREIAFRSDDANDPARFYLVSYPAHAAYPSAHVARDAAQMTELGTQEQANRRKLYKYFHPDGVPTAQLVMGMTELREGSVWNTMPAHTHARRTEVYLYFDVPAESVVFHVMGEPERTRHIVVRDSQVVLSPAWSVHSGCGTRNYTFCWAMGGENQVFADMQMVEMGELR